MTFLITGEDEDINNLIQKLKSEFEAKDLDEVKNFLGMEIELNTEQLKITQRTQIQKMLRKFNMEESKTANTPMIKGFQVDKNEEIITKVPYREIIGSLMFVSTVSRPDITYATSYLSRYLD